MPIGFHVCLSFPMQFLNCTYVFVLVTNMLTCRVNQLILLMQGVQVRSLRAQSYQGLE